jgi:hypothetical protein
MSPATGWKEHVPAGEAEKLEALAAQLLTLQRSRAAGRKARRALHAKQHLGVDAELAVLPDVPEHARVGLFATPAKHRAYVRFSNGASSRRADKSPDQRGLALKVVGVPGKKIIPGLENATTQDFLLIRAPATPFVDAEDFVWFVRAVAQPALFLPKAIGRFGPLGGIRMIRRILADGGITTPSMATARFFSALPTRFGPYAAKWDLEPSASGAGAPGEGRDYLAEDMAARLASGPVSWTLRAQFFVDEATTPIEDASVEWREDVAPFVPLARLTVPKQDVRSARGTRLHEWVETLSFDPWHAPEEFRPLGAMMRARNVAYRVSTQERGAAPEPDGTERFD